MQRRAAPVPHTGWYRSMHTTAPSPLPSCAAPAVWTGGITAPVSSMTGPMPGSTADSADVVSPEMPLPGIITLSLTGWGWLVPVPEVAPAAPLPLPPLPELVGWPAEAPVLGISALPSAGCGWLVRLMLPVLPVSTLAVRTICSQGQVPGHATAASPPATHLLG